MLETVTLSVAQWPTQGRFDVITINGLQCVTPLTQRHGLSTFHSPCVSRMKGTLDSGPQVILRCRPGPQLHGSLMAPRWVKALLSAPTRSTHAHRPPTWPFLPRRSLGRPRFCTVVSGRWAAASHKKSFSRISAQTSPFSLILKREALLAHEHAWGTTNRAQGRLSSVQSFQATTH